MKYFVWIIFLFISFSSSLQAQKVKEETWQLTNVKDNSHPDKRSETTFVNIGSKFYVLGSRGLKSVDIYDAKKQTWSKGAQPPVEIHHLQAVAYNQQIYVIGALTGGYPGETPVPYILIYDPKTDTWKKGDNIPENRLRGSTGVAVYQDKIYVVCGIKNGHIDDHKTWLDVYDPKTGTWTALPDAPRARDHFQATVAGDKLYVIGGRVSKAPKEVLNHTIAEVDVYDFKTQQWNTLAKPLPTLRAGTYNLLVNNEIWVMGGESITQEPAHNEVEALNIQTNEWRKLPSLLQGRHGTGAVLYKNRVYVATGCGKRGGAPELDTMEFISIKK